ncbi:MAG: trypsin-like peptidase domain-containing protein [Spirochaetaceae bacterium]
MLKKIILILLASLTTLSFASTEKDNPFRKVARDVRPVVVQIDTVYKTKVKTGGSPFDFFFKGEKNEEPENEPEYREYESSGLGSGIIVEARGKKKYVLTNHHVIKDAHELNVHFSTGKSYEATLVGSDPRIDLALLVFETKDIIPVAKLGNSDDIYIGDWAIAIGSPLGYESSVTLGIISAVGRPAVNGGMKADFTDYIQTDAAINKGNSGGALVNIDGEIIGINTWIASQTGGNIGLGFSIPINNAKRVIASLIEKGTVDYGWLGVSMGNVPKENQKDKSAKITGSFIYSLYKGSPADKGGMLPGDIITKVNSKTIATSSDLLKAVGNLPAGKLAIFKVIRGKELLTLRIYPEVRDEDSQKSYLWPGINIITLTTEIIDSMNERSETKLKKSTDGVVVVAVSPDSVAKLTGLVPGDIITHIDSRKVGNLSDFYKAIANTKEEVVLNVIRNGKKIKLILMNE